MPKGTNSEKVFWFLIGTVAALVMLILMVWSSKGQQVIGPVNPKYNNPKPLPGPELSLSSLFEVKEVKKYSERNRLSTARVVLILEGFQYRIEEDNSIVISATETK